MNENDISNQVKIFDAEYESTMKNFDFAKHINEYLNSYIRLADTKAGVIIALSIGFITLLINQNIIEFLYAEYLNTLIKMPAFYILTISLILLVLGLIFSIVVIFPRTSIKGKEGLIFWDNIKNIKKNEYIQKVLELNDKDIINCILEHNHDLAEVAGKKYRYLRLSIWIATIGLLLGLLILLLN